MCSGVTTPRILGAKMFDFRQITLFCLEKRLSKHKVTIYSKKFWGHGPFDPPGYAYTDVHHFKYYIYFTTAAT